MNADKLPLPFAGHLRQKSDDGSQYIEVNGQKINVFIENDSQAESYIYTLPSQELVRTQIAKGDQGEPIGDNITTEAQGGYPRYKYNRDDKEITFTRQDYAQAPIKIITQTEFVDKLKNSIGAYDPKYITELTQALNERIEYHQKKSAAGDSKTAALGRSYKIITDGKGTVVKEIVPPAAGWAYSAKGYNTEQITGAYVNGEQYKPDASHDISRRMRGPRITGNSIPPETMSRLRTSVTPAQLEKFKNDMGKEGVIFEIVVADDSSVCRQIAGIPKSGVQDPCKDNPAQRQ